jgi:hypothetical protein
LSKKAPFLEFFVCRFKEIFSGKFEHAISLYINIKKPIVQNSENWGQIIIVPNEIIEMFLEQLA